MLYKEIHLSSIDSTNNYLKENYESLANLSFVTADYQSGGKGRNGRKWFSLPGENLLFSLLIKDLEGIDDPSLISVFSAICVAKTLEHFGVTNVTIKWPNDVYANGKKICGILSEGKFVDNKLIYVIPGIGVNVNQTEMNEQLFHEFTSMALECSKTFKIDEVKDVLFPLMLKMVNDASGNHDEYYAYLNSHNYLYQKEVYALINNEKVLVKVLHIIDGKLEVLYNDQKILLNSGEVTFHL